MTYLYRPTPVVNVIPPPPPSLTVRGGMQGVILGHDYKPYYSAMKSAAAGNPWINRSGTMGSFLAQDIPDTSSLPPIDVPIDFTMPGGLDTSPLMFPPLYPSTLPPDISGGMPGGGGSILDTSGLGPVFPGIGPMYGPPAPAGSIQTAGGTLAPAIAQTASLFTSIGNSIKSFFTPKVPTPAGYTQLPATAQPSIFTQPNSLFPSLPNWAVIGGALLGVGALMMTMRGGSRGGK